MNQTQKQPEKPVLYEITDALPFIDQLFTQQVEPLLIDEWKEYDTTVNPTFDVRQYLHKAYQIYLISQLNKYGLETMLRNTDALFENFVRVNARSKLYNVMLHFYMTQKFIVPQKVSVKYQRAFQDQLKKLWRQVHQDKMAEFITVFQLQEIIEKGEVAEHIRELIRSNETKDQLIFERAFRLIRIFGMDLNLVRDLLAAMPIESASKMADYIIESKIDPSEFPHQWLTTIKGYYSSKKTYCWEKIEDLIQDNPEAMQIYISSSKTKPAIARRLTDKYLKKEEPILTNKLLDNDAFMPSEKIIENSLAFLSIEDLGLSQQQVHFIDHNPQEAWDMIHGITGLDTEGGGQNQATKMDRIVKSQGLLQIATKNVVIVFDCVALNDDPIMKQNLIEYLNRDTILGLSLANDIGLVQTSPQKYVELQTLHKNMKKEDQKSSLAHLSEVYLGKQLSKLETISNWNKRPLRQAQIHYAALDALVCLHIYERMQS